MLSIRLKMTLIWHFLQILALQDERRAAEVAREEAERARKREAEEDKLKMKAAIEREARLAERREAVRLARQQEAQVTRNADKSKITVDISLLAEVASGASFDSYRSSIGFGTEFRSSHSFPLDN